MDAITVLNIGAKPIERREKFADEALRSIVCRNNSTEIIRQHALDKTRTKSLFCLLTDQLPEGGRSPSR